MRTHPCTHGILALLVVALALPATASAENTTELSSVALSSVTLLADDDADAHYADMAERVLHPTNYRHRHRRGRVIVLERPPRRVVRTRRVRRNTRRSRGSGSIYFGIGVLGNFFLETGEQVSKVYRGGGGFNLSVGARLSDYIGLELSYMAAFQSTASTSTGAEISNGSVQAISFDGKIYFVGGQSAIQPFVQIGIGAYILSETFQEQLTGVGLDLGGGVDIRLSHFFRLGLRLLYRGFFVDNSDADYHKIATQSAFLNAISAEANAQFHF